MTTRPEDVLYDVALAAGARVPESVTRGGPGAFIAALPEETRAVLRELRSQDAQDVARLFCGPFEQSGWARRHYGQSQ